LLYLAIYFGIISLFAILMTAHNKHAAKAGSRLTRERTLLFIAAIGGSIAMLLSMRMLRHKTKHAKFMLGIPLIIILQVAAGLLIWWHFGGSTILLCH